MSKPATEKSRIAWVDYAKGYCIIIVVMMHSTLGAGKATGGEGCLQKWWPSPSRSGCPISS